MKQLTLERENIGLITLFEAYDSTGNAYRNDKVPYTLDEGDKVAYNFPESIVIETAQYLQAPRAAVLSEWERMVTAEDDDTAIRAFMNIVNIFNDVYEKLTDPSSELHSKVKKQLAPSESSSASFYGGTASLSYIKDDKVVEVNDVNTFTIVFSK